MSKGEKRPLRGFLQVNYARRRERVSPLQWRLAPAARASRRKQDVVSDVVGYTRRGTVHTGWASRTLEAKEERRSTGTTAICGHRVDERACKYARRLVRPARVAPLSPLKSRANLSIRWRVFQLGTGDLLIVHRLKSCSVIVDRSLTPNRETRSRCLFIFSHHTSRKSCTVLRGEIRASYV